jgi:hypothetical protein
MQRGFSFTCVHSTASLEAAALAGHALPVPVFVDKLIKKILAGDSDAADLTGSGRALLLGNGAAPTAIKAQYFWFNFSDSNSSAWWQRSSIPNNPAVVYTQAHDRSSILTPPLPPLTPCLRWPSASSRPPYRPHILVTAALSAAASLAAACHPSSSPSQRAAAVSSALAYALAFAAALLCPAVPVLPAAAADAHAAFAKATRVINLHVIAGFCSAAVAAAAAVHRGGLLQVTVCAVQTCAAGPHAPQACACAFVLLSVLSNWQQSF